MRYIILFFSILLVANEPKVTVEQLFSVQLVEVKKITTAKEQKNYGFVSVDDSKKYSVSPRFSGYIEKLYADKIYKYVKKGDILARVYSPTILNAKEEYLASLLYARDGKNKEMVKNSREKLVLLNINEKEINLIKNTKSVSNYTEIYAPFSGYIFTKNILNLDSFKAGQKLFEIVNIDNVWVEAKIYQKELTNLSSMIKFDISSIGIDEKFSAKKDILYPSMSKDESTFTLRLNVKNKKHLLKNGMYVTIKSSGAKQEYLTLPTTAVIRKNNLFYAFVESEYEGEYEPTEVEVKVLNANTYIILSGIEEGDAVVNNALFMIDSDAQINGLY